MKSAFSASRYLALLHCRAPRFWAMPAMTPPPPTFLAPPWCWRSTAAKAPWQGPTAESAARNAGRGVCLCHHWRGGPRGVLPPHGKCLCDTWVRAGALPQFHRRAPCRAKARSRTAGQITANQHTARTATGAGCVVNLYNQMHYFAYWLHKRPKKGHKVPERPAVCLTANCQNSILETLTENKGVHPGVGGRTPFSIPF